MKHLPNCNCMTYHRGACWPQDDAVATQQQPQKPATMPNDPISPLHYVKGGIEVRHVIRAFECTYNVGTAVSYLLRSKFKANYAEDIAKAIKHLQFELEDYKEKP